MAYPSFIDHLVFRVADLGRTERFYQVLLGEPTFKGEGFLFYTVGETRIFFTSTADSSGGFDKEAVGLNHLALGVRSRQELEAIEERLNGGGVRHSGISVDKHGKKDYIWLDDPDGF